MSAVISPSSLLRQLRCPGSLSLPKAENYSEAAEAGTAEHEVLSDFAALDPVIAAMLPPNPRSEVKLAYDVVTGDGRIIGYGSDRNYGTLGVNEIAGTADVVGSDDHVAYIRDFKTGYADIEPASTNPQIAFYGLAYARALGLQRADVGLIYTKAMREDVAQLNAFDLGAFAQQLKALHQRSKQPAPEHPDTVEGRWCAYCPSKPFCPAKNAMIVKVASGGLARLGDSEITPHRARLAYQQLVNFESIVKDARKRLEQYVSETGPLDLGEGRAYGRYVRPGNEKVSAESAIEAFHSLFSAGGDVGGFKQDTFESIATERVTSKAAIERACKLTEMPVKPLMAEIRKTGGIQRGPDTMPIGEYDTGRYEAAPPLDVAAVNAQLEAAK
jgi:hypothetical protein